MYDYFLKYTTNNIASHEWNSDALRWGSPVVPIVVSQNKVYRYRSRACCATFRDTEVPEWLWRRWTDSPFNAHLVKYWISACAVPRSAQMLETTLYIRTDWYTRIPLTLKVLFFFFKTHATYINGCDALSPHTFWSVNYCLEGAEKQGVSGTEACNPACYFHNSLWSILNFSRLVAQSRRNPWNPASRIYIW